MAALPRAAVFLDLIGRAELEAVRPVPMQARQVQIIVARDLRHRLAGGKPTVDLRTLEMLTARTLSTHNVEINMGILIKRKGNCGPGNDRPKVIRYRQKSIIFRNAAFALRLASSNHGWVGVTAKSKRAEFF